MMKITLTQKSGKQNTFIYDGNAIEISVQSTANESKTLHYTTTQMGFGLHDEMITHEVIFKVEEEDAMLKAREAK
jgi:hypothetical protein